VQVSLLLTIVSIGGRKLEIWNLEGNFGRKTTVSRVSKGKGQVRPQLRSNQVPGCDRKNPKTERRRQKGELFLPKIAYRKPGGAFPDKNGGNHSRVSEKTNVASKLDKVDKNWQQVQLKELYDLARADRNKQIIREHRHKQKRQVLLWPLIPKSLRLTYGFRSEPVFLTGIFSKPMSFH